MLGWSTYFKILTSLNNLSLSSSARFFLLTIFTALRALVSLCKHLRTSPKDPIKTKRYKLNISICKLTSTNAARYLVEVFNASCILLYKHLSNWMFGTIEFLRVVKTVLRAVLLSWGPGRVISTWAVDILLFLKISLLNNLSWCYH